VNSVTLFEGSPNLLVLSRPPGLFLQFKDDRLAEGEAEFQIQISLLKSVASGFSYQIANSCGSLHIVLNGGLVVITLHLSQKEKIHAKIAKETFSSILEKLLP
jgi:hypothetical protein